MLLNRLKNLGNHICACFTMSDVQCPPAVQTQNLIFKYSKYFSPDHFFRWNPVEMVERKNTNNTQSNRVCLPVYTNALCNTYCVLTHVPKNDFVIQPSTNIRLRSTRLTDTLTPSKYASRSKMLGFRVFLLSGCSYSTHTRKAAKIWIFVVIFFLICLIICLRKNLLKFDYLVRLRQFSWLRKSRTNAKKNTAISLINL